MEGVVGHVRKHLCFLEFLFNFYLSYITLHILQFVLNSSYNLYIKNNSMNQYKIHSRILGRISLESRQAYYRVNHSFTIKTSSSKS